jgi:hypothetical protein
VLTKSSFNFESLFSHCSITRWLHRKRSIEQDYNNKFILREIQAMNEKPSKMYST